ncbi:MAG: hypothetical protein ABMA01_06205 [Chthoniobacteraceae bacterium]
MTARELQIRLHAAPPPTLLHVLPESTLSIALTLPAVPDIMPGDEPAASLP